MQNPVISSDEDVREPAAVACVVNQVLGSNLVGIGKHKRLCAQSGKLFGIVICNLNRVHI
jgi:hypothetical protein